MKRLWNIISAEPIGLLGLLLGLFIGIIQYMDFRRNRTVDVTIVCDPVEVSTVVYLVRDDRMFPNGHIEVETPCLFTNRSPFKYSLSGYRLFAVSEATEISADFIRAPRSIINTLPHSAAHTRRPNWGSYIAAQNIVALDAYESKVLFTAYAIPLRISNVVSINNESCKVFLAGDALEVQWIADCLPAFQLKRAPSWHRELRRTRSVCLALKRGIKYSLLQRGRVRFVGFTILGRDGEAYINFLEFAAHTSCNGFPDEQ